MTEMWYTGDISELIMPFVICFACDLKVFTVSLYSVFIWCMKHMFLVFAFFIFDTNELIFMYNVQTLRSISLFLPEGVMVLHFVVLLLYNYNPVTFYRSLLEELSNMMLAEC